MSKVVDLHSPPLRRTQILPHGVMGMLIFIVAETMMFAGLISAFLIVKGAASIWPPPGQPRLPIEQTALNTTALLLSAVLLWYANKLFKERGPAHARGPLFAAMALGTFFVCFQGYEWAQLISQGLTMTSSTLGSFFYLIVGMHALHAIAALFALGRSVLLLQRGRLVHGSFAAAQVFWYFVVGIWPVLYLQVYL